MRDGRYCNCSLSALHNGTIFTKFNVMPLTIDNSSILIDQKNEYELHTTNVLNTSYKACHSSFLFHSGVLNLRLYWYSCCELTWGEA